MKHVLVLSAILIISACSPAPVYHLTSRDTDVAWYHGQQLVRREAGGITLVVSFHRSWNSFLVFDVEIINRSDSTILVEPEKFHHRLSMKSGDATVGLTQKFAAINPEGQLALLDKASASEEARHQTMVALETIAEVADLVGDVAASGERTAEEEDRDERRDFERAASRHMEDVEYENTITNLSDLREYWATHALRKTHVGPRQSVGGKVAMAAYGVTAFMKGELSNRATTKLRSSKPRPEYVLTMVFPVGDTTHAVEYVVRKL